MKTRTNAQCVLTPPARPNIIVHGLDKPGSSATVSNLWGNLGMAKSRSYQWPRIR
jgi:hypothetical protein